MTKIENVCTYSSSSMQLINHTIIPNVRRFGEIVHFSKMQHGQIIRKGFWIWTNIFQMNSPEKWRKKIIKWLVYFKSFKSCNLNFQHAAQLNEELRFLFEKKTVLSIEKKYEIIFCHIEFPCTCKIALLTTRKGTTMC